MVKREKLVSILKKITDDEFAALWKNTYGCLPQGSRSELEGGTSPPSNTMEN